MSQIKTCVWGARAAGVIVFISLNQLRPCVLHWRGLKWWHAHTSITYLPGEAGKSAFQRTVCQHMWRADMVSNRNRLIQRGWRRRWSRKTRERERERERGGGRWRGRLCGYFSPFSLQPYQSLMSWDNSCAPEPCYTPSTLPSHISSANFFIFLFSFFFFTSRLHYFCNTTSFLSSAASLVPPSVSSTSIISTCHPQFSPSVANILRTPKWNWRNPSLKYCYCCTLSFPVSFPCDDPFLISFFP